MVRGLVMVVVGIVVIRFAGGSDSLVCQWSVLGCISLVDGVGIDRCGMVAVLAL